MMTNRIEVLNNIDYRLVKITNTDYNISSIIYIYDDYVLTSLSNSKNNRLKLNLLGEINKEEFFKKCYSEHLGELSFHLNNYSVANKNYSIRTIVCGNVNPKEFSQISNEDDLVEIINNINNIDNENETVSFYFGWITINNLYKQFKGKDNFIKIYTYIKDILNDKTS